MRFIVSSTAFLSHLQAISRVINSKNTLPIMDCFLLNLEDGTLYITASDTETTMSTSIEVTESDSNGSFAIAARTLLDAMKGIPEQPVTFNINLQSLEITVQYMNGQYSVIGQNADEYPSHVPLGEKSVHLDIPANILLDGINRTIFATADDELRPVMNGIYFDITPEDVTMVASDSHKLVRNKNYTVKGSDRAAFILPKKPANLLKNILTREENTVSIDFDERNAVITMENFKMICRLIEGRYPNYNSVIPQDNPYKIIIDRNMFLSAMRRVSVFSSQSSSLVKLSLEENKLIISTQDIDFSTSAEESILCQYSGIPMSIGFKAPFLIDILNNTPGQEVIIELADPSRAGVIVPSGQEEGSLLMLLMPMMLND